MTTTLHGPGDWDANDTDDEAEDLGALGMSVKDADKLDVIDDEEEGADTPVPAAAVDEEEPKDGLALLDELEKELEEPEIDLGEDEDDR